MRLKAIIKKAVPAIALLILALALAGCGKPPEKLVVGLENTEGTQNPFTGIYTEEKLPARPIMVSTDNVNEAIPQYGLSQADIVYEVPVEGKQSRLEAIYYSDMPEVVGPCRSVRPYIVDLAREYDAILTHNGWSPAAKEYLQEGLVADIPAQKYSFYYRTKDKPAPHNSLVKTGDVLAAAEEAGYMDEEVQLPAFSFLDERDLAVMNGTQEEFTAKYEAIAKERLEDPQQEYEIPSLEGIEAPVWSGDAARINVSYVNCKAVYTWDPQERIYTREVNGQEYRDLNNDEQIKTNNIIVYKLNSRVLDHKGRLDIDLTTGGDAWIFTLGKVVQCKWSKADLDSPTVFTDEEGNNIKISQGKTWINIIDGDTKFSYE